ncbi:BMC domain-containing protein [Cohnella pontilimi]|uniref:BMC domain-containing protein n=1 Tax=Cohnella pontilimi TaxID=2564100 RepID=A0A4U0FK81_9BACL|nr:BMC domain-containing protein [Cohnella pontilimi]TJY43952.1 BMC domain-containing protein [Cohnella pontilimi]
MEPQVPALGMIETWGVPALIAAADAAAKAANVRVTTYEKADAGIVTVYLIGDVASVKAAVEAGAAAARQVGQLLASHVIPRPDASVPQMLQMLERPEEPVKPEPRLPESGMLHEAIRAPEFVPEWDKLPVQELRRIARNTPGFPLSGRQISTAGKAVLLRLLTEHNP